MNVFGVSVLMIMNKQILHSYLNLTNCLYQSMYHSKYILTTVSIEQSSLSTMYI